MAESSRLTAELGAEADTAALGAQLAGLVARTGRARSVLIALSGPLGAGKTTLVRSFLRSLGHSGAVRSPTYTLVEVYEFSGFNVAHLDLYRLGDDSELEYLGYRDFSESGWVVLVEWPERAGRAQSGVFALSGRGIGPRFHRKVVSLCEGLPGFPGQYERGEQGEASGFRA